VAAQHSRPFAVFDIDGTVLRWQLFHAVVDVLGRQGHLPPEAYKKIREARKHWKNRKTDDAFREYEVIQVQVFEEALPNMSVAHAEAAASEAFDEYKDQVYRYTRQLIRDLKAKNYLLFAISGSGIEIVKLFTKHHGFDDARGSKAEVIGDRYSGKVDVAKTARKGELLAELVAKHHATFKGSIAVGDSESDIKLLEMVEQPIAFNPSKKLFQHAQAHSWKIVLERKNVIYELEPKNHTYVLGKTNV